MEIKGIKATKVFAGPGNFAWIAEAIVTDENDELYVTVQYYDGEEYTVQKESMYEFLAEDGDEPEEEFLEEYDSFEAAGESKYAKIFEQLRKVLELLG